MVPSERLKRLTEGQKKILEFGVLYAKGVMVFIYKEWWMQLAKYPSRVSPDVYSVLLSGKNSDKISSISGETHLCRVWF